MSGGVRDDVGDYVVVGGGSAGCVLAGRLAAAGAEVVVLEAGGTDRRPDVLVPAGVALVYRIANWRYVPEPDPSRGGAVEAWPAGRILGGGGSINATVFVRGNPADYDSWAAQGATGWSYADVLPYFRRMESWEGGADPHRGGDGPIAVGVHTMDHPGNDAFLASARQAGHALNPDYNGRTQDGVGLVQVNQRRGVRSQSSRGHLRGLPGAVRPRVITHARVERVLVEDGSATGAVYRHRGGELRCVRARREVILAAGSLATPRLLMLSGIGPAGELARCGIRVLHDSPQVGENLQEHPAVMQRWEATVPTLNRMGATDALRAAALWARTGRGLLAATVFHVQVMHRTDPAMPAPNAQIAFANFATVREVGKDGMLKVKPSRDQGFLVSTLMLHPRVRGRLRLRSASPDHPPVIEHRLLDDSRDLADLLDGMEEGRRIMGQAAMAPFVSGMFAPERDCRTREDWEAFARANATYGAHPVGTCRMGGDPGAVVDPELRVRGIEALRVVDASVMPSLPSGNTNAAAMMIGERGADLVLGRVERRARSAPVNGRGAVAGIGA